MFKLTEPHTKQAHFNGQRLRWREGTSSSSFFSWRGICSEWVQGNLERRGGRQRQPTGRSVFVQKTVKDNRKKNESHKSYSNLCICVCIVIVLVLSGKKERERKGV